MLANQAKPVKISATARWSCRRDRAASSPLPISDQPTSTATGSASGTFGIVPSPGPAWLISQATPAPAASPVAPSHAGHAPSSLPPCAGRAVKTHPDRGGPAYATDVVGELGDAVRDGGPAVGLGDAPVEPGEHARVAGGPAPELHAEVDRDDERQDAADQAGDGLARVGRAPRLPA